MVFCLHLKIVNILKILPVCAVLVLFTEDKDGHGVADTVSNHEKAVLRNEFLEIMKQRFLEGKDSDFDYR